MDANRLQWFGRGVAAAILACGAFNAASYFVWSERGGDLVGLAPQHAESLGFPLKMWQKGDAYGGRFIDVGALAVNVAFGLAIGALLGVLAVRSRRRWERMIQDFEAAERVRPRTLQFSMRGLIWLTTVVAGVAALSRYLPHGRPEVLLGLYVLGPTVLIALAYIPRGIGWQQRVALLLLLIPVAIGMAIYSGAHQQPPLEFDKVLLGIFICWTPQSALAAAVVTAATVYYYELGRTAESGSCVAR